MMAARKDDMDSFHHILDQQAKDAQCLQQQMLEQQNQFREEQRKRDAQHEAEVRQMQAEIERAASNRNNEAVSTVKAALAETERENREVMNQLQANHTAAMDSLQKTLQAIKFAPPPKGFS
ncbi:unnamed protein product, partial [Rotaria sp. Silwood1]